MKQCVFDSDLYFWDFWMYKSMCNSAASCHSCPVCPLRTKRTLTFHTPWGISLLSLSLANSTRHQSTKRQRNLRQQPTEDWPASLGLPPCPVPSPATLLALQQSLIDQVVREQKENFTHRLWGGSSSLRCLWIVHLARPHVHTALGDALTPTSLQRCVSVCQSLCQEKPLRYSKLLSYMFQHLNFQEMACFVIT